MAERYFWYFFKFSVVALILWSGFFLKMINLRFSLALPPSLRNINQTVVQDSSPTMPPTTRHPLAPPYPYAYTFLMNLQEKCQNRDPFLVLLVASASHDIDSRLAVRETWGNESNYGEQLLEEENRIYGDIVQQDFMDTYYNLTLKTLMGIEWVTKYCPTASYVMKTDSDMFLNVEYLIHKVLLPGTPVRENFYTGDIRNNTGPIRNHSNKWYVPEEIYPSNIYPPYFSGSGYVFSANLAQKIYEQRSGFRSCQWRCFVGLCFTSLLSRAAPRPKIFNGNYKEYDRCLFHKLVTVHSYARERLRDVWKDFWSKKSSGCPD
ncbi:hypothetical protein GDO86_020556 [Hymenochirus boettgeri]|uniref:Hexosyltransferase n=1 Tax=Hymenochirus boettgeri TaxID=247094 RepID=A0A8T2IKS4_9PIPI|nr:hypothetical protein GDO86_020556 [Hymenochirus boettgeri]